MRGHDEGHALGALQLGLALPQGLLDPEPLEGTPAVIRQRLEHGQIVGVVGVRGVALDGEDAGHALAVADRHEHERRRRPAHRPERRQALGRRRGQASRG